MADESTADRDALAQTGAAIRAAFARGDLETILAYHHPEVIKALGYDKHLIGREAVRADIRGTLELVALEWTDHRVENILVRGDVAVEQTMNTIRGMPRAGGQPFVVQGRALVVYVRFPESPTGWASIREIFQPAS
jgi:ketosteroid isomerase-like protein